MIDDFDDYVKQQFPSLCANVYCGVSVASGWHPLVCKALESLKRVSPDSKVVQIKEKFGGLRLYVDDATEQGRAVIRSAEWASWLICEKCGTTVGVTTEGKWLKTLCLDCRVGPLAA